MRTFYKRVKLTKDNRTRDLHRHKSARSETVDINAADPSRQGSRGTLVIWRNDAVAPGMFLCVHQDFAKGIENTHNAFSAQLAVIVNVDLNPDPANVELAEAFERQLTSSTKKGGEGGKKPNHPRAS